MTKKSESESNQDEFEDCAQLIMDATINFINFSQEILFVYNERVVLPQLRKRRTMKSGTASHSSDNLSFTSGSVVSSSTNSGSSFEEMDKTTDFKPPITKRQKTYAIKIEDGENESGRM